ncbi:unnamed protein product, partial [Coregonus sp. 'balchen']
MELQQQQQQVVQLEGLENATARTLLGKLINVLLAVMAVLLVFVSTVANCVVPLMKTRSRTFSTLLFVVLLAFLWRNWEVISQYLDRFLLSPSCSFTLGSFGSLLCFGLILSCPSAGLFDLGFLAGDTLEADAFAAFLSSKRQELVVYINMPMHAIMDTMRRNLPQPSLTVIPAVIKERNSVQLNCQTAPSVSECYFKIEGQVEFTLPSPCQQTLTGTLLLRWTGQISPAEVKIQCQYIATGSQFRSINNHPQLTVSSTVIRERESVQLSCETPPSLHVSHCYFYIEGVKNLPHSSCTQTITGTELLKRAGSTIPAVVKVKCYYAIGKSHISPFSDPVSVTVLDPKPDITVHFDGHFSVLCLIPGSVSPDTTCNLYVGEESQPSFTAKIKKTKAPSAFYQWFCQFIVTESDLVSGLQSVRRKEVSCDYRVSSGPNSLSPHSDGYRFTVGLTPGPRSTLPATTTVSPTEGLTSPLTTSTALNPTSESTVCCTLTTDTPASPTERGQSSTESDVESNSQKSILDLQPDRMITAD